MKLDEATRKELLDKSKSASVVKSYGTTRYDRRSKQIVSKSVSSFNKIDFNALFRANLLSFKIQVKGETNTYENEFLFEGICDDIKHEIQMNNNELDYKCIYRALVDAVNRQDIMISCTCDDWRYRQSYYATKQGYNSGQSELRPAKITNPDDSAGAGCKHLMSSLGNLDWTLKLASSIFNYICYMRDNEEAKFANIMFPKLFDISYEEYSQKNSQFATGDDELANTMNGPEEDQEVVDTANDREEPEEEIPEEPTEEEEEIES